MVKVSVIVVNWNGGKVVMEALRSLSHQTYQDMEIIVVDNGSVDGSPNNIKREFGLDVIKLERNMGFAEANNIGVDASSAPYIALLNSDAKAHHHWLSALMEQIEKSPDNVAALSSKVLLKDTDIIESIGLALARDGTTMLIGYGEGMEEEAVPIPVMAPSGAACLYRRKVFNALGGFDTRFFAYGEDIDLGIRLHLSGYRCIYTPGAVVRHYHSFSNIRVKGMPRRYFIIRNKLYLIEKYFSTYDMVKALPYIGLNLINGFFYDVIYHRSFATIKAIVHGLAAYREIHGHNAYLKWSELRPMQNPLNLLKRQGD